MARSVALRRFAIGLALVLAVTIGLFAHRSTAAARATIYTSSGSAPCFGGTVPAAYQDSKIGLGLLYFESADDVFVDITFPDGRVFTQRAAFGPSGNVNYGLDGVVDQPINAASVTDVYGGQTFAPLRVTNDFPYGCYQVAARSNTHNAITTFAVIPRNDPIPFAGQASLRVEDRTTGAVVVQHGGAVNILGEGFRAKERIFVWLTTPDGAVLSWPEQFTDPAIAAQLLTNDAGRFVASFEFASYNPVGLYKVTAKGEQSGYTVISPITLVARPIQTQGWAGLRVAYPSFRTGQQRNLFEIQGERFNAGERVDIWVNFPDGAVRGMPSQYVDAGGMFYVELGTDEVLPTGEYKFTAKGAESGNLIITAFTLTQAVGVNPIVTDPFDPRITESNTGGDTLGSAGLVSCSEGTLAEQNAADNPGPDVSGFTYPCK
jgi:hypothetical protein